MTKLIAQLIDNLSYGNIHVYYKSDEVIILYYAHPDRPHDYNIQWTMQLTRFDYHVGTALNKNNLFLLVLNKITREELIVGEIKASGFVESVSINQNDTHNHILVPLLEDTCKDNLHDNWHEWAKRRKIANLNP